MTERSQAFQQLLDVSKDFGQARDVDFLLEKILTTARRLGNAEVGSIYIMEGEVLRHHHTRNGVSQCSVSPDNAQQHLYDPSSYPLPDECIPNHILRTGNIINIADISQFPSVESVIPEPSYTHYPHTTLTAILAFPLKTHQGKIVGVIQLINPRDNSGTITAAPEDDIPLIQLFASNAASAIERAQNTRVRIQGIIQILTALRDTEETVAHVNRVGAYAAEVYETWARKKALPAQEIAQCKDSLRLAAMLHDIGKLAIPSVIRKKPGKLSEEEYDTMKEHTTKGAQLLIQHANSEIERVAADIALTHHERWDGRGYPGHIDPATGTPLECYEDEKGCPKGKKGEEIPVFGRIVAIVDVYDALMNHRVFREAWKEEDVLKTLQTESGTHFDPEMIDAFFETLDTIRAISKRFPDA
ncbi:phosphohydrolase [candidate division KSB3 bacterium]|uniref:Phosphohydrolase n=1 Tax=candidate division KSB3 bacterium TaxID=2044937 RepID=A0A2G6KEY5_9BACT|nr:MAG: phosphohydrolase [candidate division KSB3 bacterium]